MANCGYGWFDVGIFVVGAKLIVFMATTRLHNLTVKMLNKVLIRKIDWKSWLCEKPKNPVSWHSLGQIW